MYNPKRGTVVEATVMALAGVVVVSLALEATTDISLGLRIIAGAVYGLMAYLAWWLFINSCGSFIYEENVEPEEIDVIAAIFAFLLAIPVLIVSGTFYFMWLYQKVRESRGRARQ